MKALTLWQPYATAIASELKRFETRSWSTSYRGLLAIHAAKRPLGPYDQKLAETYALDPGTLPLGAVVAIVELQECIAMTPEFIRQQSPQEIAFGDWRPGRFAWRLRLVERMKKPLPASGKQGLWNWTR